MACWLRLPLQFKNDSAAGFRADGYRASSSVPLLLTPDSTQRLLAGANLEMLSFSGSRPGFGVSAGYGFAPVLGCRVPTR